MKAFIPLIFIMATSLLNCNSQDNRDDQSLDSSNPADTVRNLLAGFIDEHPFLDKDNWELETYSSNDFSNNLRISRNDNGVEYIVELTHVKKAASEDGENHYVVNTYNQYFTDSSFCYYVHMKNDVDTLYYYKKERIDSAVFELDKMNFMVGKYQYLFDNRLMSLNQANYFKSNQDSLRHIQGNDIAELPKSNE